MGVRRLASLGQALVMRDTPILQNAQRKCQFTKTGLLIATTERCVRLVELLPYFKSVVCLVLL